MKKSSVALPLADFKCALELCEKFNLSSAARPQRRVQTVLSQALREMQPLARAISAGQRIEAGYHSGSDDLLTLQNGQEQALRQDIVAHLAGKVAISLSILGADHLASIKNTFGLAHDSQAAALAVRIYARMLDNLWRGNHLSIWDQDNRQVPYDTDALKKIASRPWSP